MTHRILVVEDEADTAELMADHLASVGYRVSTAASGAEALKLAREERPDVVVLDLVLPEMSGWDLLQELRRLDETRDAGVILLTSQLEEVDRMRAMSLGAEDFVTKPVSPEELTTCVDSLLRRLASPAVSAGSMLATGPIRVDRSAQRVTADGEEITLTAKEYKLLLALMERRGRVQSRPQLLELVWDARPDIRTRTVDIHVQRLRSKLGEYGDLIETARGFGYRFRADDGSSLR